MRLFVLTRHAHSTLNLAGRVNGDPSVPVPLTRQGVEEAKRLGAQVANVPFELCLHTRFARTRETAEAILGGREVPLLEQPLLDDVEIGELEGQTLEAYRAWKRAHARSDPFPGGESLDDAARRYARAFRALLARKERCVLVVCHEIPIRYALNGALGSRDLDAPEHFVPNATPFLFDAASLERAIFGIQRAVEAGSTPSATNERRLRWTPGT
jgi:broad specificity phosphatase PhoE